MFGKGNNFAFIFTICLLNVETVLTVWYFFVFNFIIQQSFLNIKIVLKVKRLMICEAVFI